MKQIWEEKANMAIECGAEKGAVSHKESITSRGEPFAPKGFDLTIIMAATESNEPLELVEEIAGKE